jgi:beta-lactamase class C
MISYCKCSAKNCIKFANPLGVQKFSCAKIALCQGRAKIVFNIFQSIGWVILCSVYANPCIGITLHLAEIGHVADEIEKESNELIGGAVAMIQGDKIIYKKTFGHKGLECGPVDDHTLFGLASVSKAITATALMVLAENKVVHFQDKVNIDGVAFSVKDILSHTTGCKIRGDYEIEKGFNRKDLQSLLKKTPRDPLKINRPYFYSNIAYSLTQDYMESKGYKIEDLIKLLNISACILPINNKNLACPHNQKKERVTFPSRYQKTVPTSAGIFSSLHGMMEFLHVILGHRPHIISKQSLSQLFTPVVKANDLLNWHILPFKNGEVTSSYCLGWEKVVLKSCRKSALVFHSGFINGASAFVGIIPALDVGIVIMVNQTSRFPLRMGLSIWKALIKRFQC